MTTDYRTAVLDVPVEPSVPDEAELAAVAFLSRCSGRTLDAYRHDLRNLFQWAADHGLPVLEATRAHLELYRSSMEERGLAPSTIDRRLSTACGFYASLTSMGASAPTRHSTFADRRSTHPSDAASTAASSVDSYSPLNASTTPRPPLRCSSD